MAQAQGKSISELGSASTYMKPDDLALISEKQSNGTYKSKAVKKEAFEKLTVSGDRDAETRSSTTYGTLSMVDSSSAHLRGGYVTNAYWANGSNSTQVVATKKCNGSD